MTASSRRTGSPRTIRCSTSPSGTHGRGCQASGSGPSPHGWAPTRSRIASVEAMARWNPAARPVPADGVRVALAAADDGTDLVVLDPGSDPEFVLRRPAVWAVAQSQPWQPPFDSEAVREAFARSIARELAVLGVTLLSGDPDARLAGPELVVRIELIAGLTREELDATTARLAHRWAADDVIATAVDSLAVKLVGTSADA